MTVNDLRSMEKRKKTNFPKLIKGPLVVLYQKNDHSEKAEKQSTRWRKILTKKKKKKKKKLCNSIIVFLVA